MNIFTMETVQKAPAASSLSDQSSMDAPKFQTYQNQCFENGMKWYLNADSADVHFTFGPMDSSSTSTSIPAHKILLAAHSHVFDAMFYGNLKEPGNVHVIDSSAAAFAEFLQYFYLRTVKLTEGNAAGVLHLSVKYDITNCVNDCVQFFMHTMDNENVCAHFQIAILYEQKRLIDACEKYMLVNTVAVFNTDGFLKCDKNVLNHILTMDVFSCSEVDVFEACMRWVLAKSECTDLSIDLVDAHLGDTYYEIRWASMTMEQLCTLQKKYESVLSRDFIAISNIIVNPDIQNSLKFKKVERQTEWNEDAIIECDRIENENDYSDDNYRLDRIEMTTFTANEPLMLGQFSCGQLFDDDHEQFEHYLPVKMEIMEASNSIGANSNLLLKMEIQLDSDETDILLSHPVLIRPEFFYTIRLGPFPRQYFYDSKDLNKVVQLESDTIKIEFHKIYRHALIYKLDFNKI